MRRFLGFALLIGCAFLSALPGFAAAAPIRLAILTGEGECAVDDATLAQVEVALTENKQVTLLERAQIRRILAEQKLSAAGLTDPTTAVKMGKLLSAEMFLFIEQLPGQDPILIRSQVVETSTGISLASGVFESHLVLRDNLPVTTIVRDGIRKLRMPLDKRRCVAVLGVRSEEPGVILNPKADALTAFLKCDLARSENVLLLDRDYVQWLRNEKRLTDAQLQLMTSVALVEGGIRRAPDGAGLLATIQVRDVNNATRSSAAFPVQGNDIVEARAAFLKQALLMLGAVPTDVAPVNPEQEAAVFMQQAQFLRVNGGREDAARLAEAAYALHPTVAICETLQQYWEFCYYRMCNGEHTVFVKLADEDKVRALEALIRARTHDLDWFTLKRAELGDKWPGPDYPPRISARIIGGPLTEFEVVTYPCSGKVLELQKQALALRREQLEIELALEYQRAVESGKCSGDYWLYWSRACDMLELRTCGYAGEKIPGLRRVFEAFSHPPAQGVAHKWVNMSRMSMLIGIPFALSGQRDAESAADHRTFTLFFQEYRKHPDPFVRAIACAALIYLKEDTIAAATQLLDIYANEIPRDHCYLAAPGQGNTISALVAPAQVVLKENRPEDAARLSEKLLGPWLQGEGDPEMVLNWSGSYFWWIETLDKLGRLNEADHVAELAAQVLGRADPPPALLREVASTKEAFEGIRIRLARRTTQDPPKDDPAWERYTFQDIPTEGSVGSTAVVYQDGRFFCLGEFEKPNGNTRYTLTVYSIPAGGKPLYEATFLSEKCLGITSIAVGAQEVYVGSESGLLVFPMSSKDGRLLREADGLPADPVSALAWFEGRLYIAHGRSLTFLGPSGLSVYDPTNRTWRLIASSNSAESGPLSRRQSYYIGAMRMDPEQGCIWILDMTGDTTVRETTWLYFPKENRFQSADRTRLPGAIARLPNGTVIPCYGVSGVLNCWVEWRYREESMFRWEERFPHDNVITSDNRGGLLLLRPGQPPARHWGHELGVAFQCKDSVLMFTDGRFYLLRERELPASANQAERTGK